MNRTRQRLPALLLTMCMVSAILPIPSNAADQLPDNVVTYIPYGETETHTIHWLQGITPPTMPGQKVEGEVLSLDNADFKLINSGGKILTPDTLQDPGKNPDVEEYYVTEYLPGNGWYDINKFNEQAGNPDSRLCFAVAATDMMYWWMDQNSDHIDLYLDRLDQEGNPLAEQIRDIRQDSSQVLQHPSTSRIYQKLIYPRYINGGGGWPDLPIDFVFNGYPAIREAPRNTPSSFQGITPGGGLFHPVFGKSILTDRLYGGRYDELNSELKTYMDNGTGVVLGYSVLGNAAHAVALWGVEYDENQQLCAIYITDNNDTDAGEGVYRFGPNGASGQDAKLIGMIRYTAYRSVDPAGLVKITTYKDPQDRGSAINGRYLLTLAEEGWAHYEEHGTPLYEDGRAFLSPIYDQVDCDHEFVYIAENGRITRGCNQCGLSEWVEIRQRESGPFVYNGYSHKPYRMYSSLGDKYPFSPTITYYDNIEAGTATVKLSYKGYSTSVNFEIEKAPQEAPTAPPVLQSKTAASITLQSVDGMEYQMDGGSWRSSPVFSGLRPESSHSFTMRRAEQKNYLPSTPSPALTIKTDAGPAAWASEIQVDSTGISLTAAAQAGYSVMAAGYGENDQMLFVATHVISEEQADGARITLSGPDFESAHSVRLFLLDSNSSPVGFSIDV